MIKRFLSTDGRSYSLLFLILPGAVGYLMFDYFIDYSSPYALIFASVLWLIIPILLSIYFSSVISHLDFITLSFLTVIFLYIMGIIFPINARIGDSDKALGFGNFGGISPSSPKLILVCIFFYIFALTISFIYLKRGKIELNSRSFTENQIYFLLNNKRRFLIYIVVFLITIPSFEAIIPNILSPLTGQDFDSQQIFAWYEFKSRGFVEMRDFWFPYGGLIHVQEGLLGSISLWIICSLSIIFLISIALIDSKIKIEVAILITNASILILHYPVIVARYFFPIISLVMCLKNLRIVNFSYFLYFLPLFLSFWLSPEISLLIFLLFIFSSFVIVFLNHINNRSSKYLILPILVVTFIYIVRIIELGTRNQLNATIYLLLNPTESIQYSYTPTLSLDFNVYANSLDFIRQLIFITFIIVSVYALLKLYTNIKNSPVSMILVQCMSVILFGYFVLQRDLIRGGIVLWISAILILSLFMILIINLETNALKNSNIIRVFLSIGLCCTLFATPFGISTFSKFLYSGQQLKYLINSIKFDYSFSSLLFHSNWNTENDSFKSNYDDILGLESTTLSNNDFYVLGDMPDLYRAFNKDPYWIVSIYNLSPLVDQERVLSQIKFRNPNFVILDKRQTSLVFDQVPSHLRIPLIYDYVINNYKLFKEFDYFDILQITSESNAIDYSYWSNILGKDIDLKGLLYSTSIPEECDITKFQNECDPYLKFEFERMNPFQKSDKVSIFCGTTNHSIEFLIPKRRDVSYLNVKRFWFWDSTCELAKTSNSAEVTLNYFAKNDKVMY